MCGIVGLLAANLTRAELAQLNDRLAHRGPDDAGVYVGEGVALATRRLSIIDVEGGHQPLSNAACVEHGRSPGPVWITYNGEVFNAPELRAELIAAGHHFRTQTDTEVIVHAYEAWGEMAVARLHGMFAFGLWDAPRRRLLLARDRLGIKPLYYAQAAGRFVFASEVRPILAALPSLARRLDPRALAHLFELGFIPTPYSAIEGVNKLPAAHFLIVEAGSIHCQRYWQLTYPPAGAHRRLSLPEAAEEFAARLRATVHAWRLSDVPVGSLLSGGVDSAALARLLAEAGDGARLHTFTLGFASAAHDEAAAARQTAHHLGSQHHELFFTAADFDHLPRVVRHLEEPQCSATSVPIYLLYRACHAAGFKVILTGEGADELLGGYHWFVGDRLARRLLRLPLPVRAALARLPPVVLGGPPASAAARRVVARGTLDPYTRYRLWHEVAAPEERAALLTTPAHLNGEMRDEALLAHRHPFDQFLWLEAHTRLVDFINFEVDRMSMAHSVEARPPFLDHELWEFCAALPPELKLGPFGDKRLLRTALRGHLPEAVLKRPKRGLAAPHAAWFLAERLPAWAEESLHGAALRETGYFNPDEVQRLRALHRARRADFSRVLMGVLTTQVWHHEVING